MLRFICIIFLHIYGVVGRNSTTEPALSTTLSAYDITSTPGIDETSSISTTENVTGYTTLSRTIGVTTDANTTTDGSGTTVWNHTTSIAVVYSNSTLLHFYSLIAIPRMIHLWPRCLVGNSCNKSGAAVCQDGVCVLLITGTANYGNVAYCGCQQFKNYPTTRINMCSDEFESYPNVREYYDMKKMERHVKLCCTTDDCNDPAKFEPMFPQKKVLSESEELVTYEKVQCWCMAIVMVIIVVIPFYYVWEEREESKKKKLSMDYPLEGAVVQIGNENKPEFEQKLVTDTVSGKLNFTELSKVFSMMRMYDKRNAYQAMVEIGDDIECSEHRTTCSGNGHNLMMALRGYTARYDNLLWKLIEHGPYKYPWTPFQLIELFDKVKGQFEIENVLLRISAPVVIIGDIRGQYADLHRWLSMVGYPPKKKLLFLGSILDESEPGSLDCFALIMALKEAYPNSVFVLRGVGETIPMRFIHRFGAKLDSVVLSEINRICAELPIAALISRKILAVHSGICHEIMSPRSFATVVRPFTFEDMPLFAKQLIFNQPTTRVKTYRVEEETRSGSYGLEAVVRVCRDMNVRMIIRSRNPLDEGILWNRGSQCNKFYDLVSIWSAPAKCANKGAVVEFDENSKMKVHLLEKQQEDVVNVHRTAEATSNSLI